MSIEGIKLRVRRLAGLLSFHIQRVLGLSPRMILHLDWNLGDEIMAIPLFAALRAKYPRARIGVQARQPELFQNNPCVHAINPSPVFWTDHVVDIRGEGRPLARLAHWGKLLGVQVADRRPRIYFSGEEKQAIRAMASSRGNETRIAISTWTAWVSKRWSPENFRRLCSEISERIPNARFLEMGKDCPFLGLGENWIGRTGVREAALILAGCHLFIGNDSGLMHLAAAAGTPAVGLFGPIDPGSLIESEESLVRPMWSDVECKGCWTRTEMPSPDQCPLGRPVCMDAIAASDVCKTALSLLAEKTPVGAA